MLDLIFGAAILVVLIVLYYAPIVAGLAFCGGAEYLARKKPNIPQAELSEFLFPMFDKYNTSKKTHSEYADTKNTEGNYKEVFGMLGIDVTGYKKFLDICALPGSASLYILNAAEEIHGVGVSLHPDRGGYRPDNRLKSHPRYTIKYIDLLSERNDIREEGFDFAYGACFIKHNVGKKTARDLYAAGFNMVINALELGGDFLYLLSYSWNPALLLDTIEVLGRYFTTVTLYKDPNYTAGLSNIYLWCRGKKANSAPDEFTDYTSSFPIYSNETLDTHSDEINRAFKIMNMRHIEMI